MDSFKKMFILVFSNIIKRKMVICYAVLLLKLVITFPMPLIQQYIIDNILIIGKSRSLPFLSIAILLIGILQILINIFYNISYNKLIQLTLFNLRNQTLKKIFNIPLEKMEGFNSSYILNRIFADSDQLVGFILGILFNALQDIAIFLIGVAILFSLSPKISYVILFLVPFSFLLYQIFKKKIYSSSLDLKEATNKLYSKTNESLNKIDLIKKNSWKIKEINKFYENFQFYWEQYLKYIKTFSFFTSISSSVTFLSSIIVLIMGIYEISNSKLTIGGLVAINLSMQYIINPIYHFSTISGNYQESAASLFRMQEILEIVEEKNGRLVLNEINTIRLNEVQFGFNDRVLINKFSFKFKKNNIYAITGKSGGGKTTLANLLLRVYPVEKDTIFFNDIDINDFEISSLHSRIMIVEQEPRLFNDTIYNNVTYNLNSINAEKINKMFEELTIMRFVDRLPNTLHTVVNENGNNISGGEKQRIALFRVILNEPDVIIMDEPTSAIDSITVTDIIELLSVLKKDKILIIITHSNELISSADYVINIDNDFSSEPSL
ncbi:ABC transporter ATP-binding protein [Paenibacillus sp. JJ1722]|uniref:ABC transporter ATP-binding protein n=1 Tax=Paenibacillus sp. JJ1722 TaxID=3398770 RepID=UPI003AAEE8E6